MSVQTFTDLGDNASIQSAIDDMENAIARGGELHEWLSDRIYGGNLCRESMPKSNASDAFTDMAGMVDQAMADMEQQIRFAQEAMTETDEAIDERKADREAQERIVL